MLVAVLEAPEPVPEAQIREIAAALSLAPADVRLRLAGLRPRILFQAEDEARVGAAEELLRRLGWRVQAFDAAAVPTDADRVLARRYEKDERGRRLHVWDAAGEAHEIAADEVFLLQRALRSQTLETKSKTSERRFAPVRALVSGGLLLTKKVESTSTKTTEKQEALLVLHRRKGEDVAFYERELDYSALGPAREPSSLANFLRLIAELRAFFPRAAFDERALRPGALGLQGLGRRDPTDLALFLVAAASWPA